MHVCNLKVLKPHQKNRQNFHCSVIITLNPILACTVLQKAVEMQLSKCITTTTKKKRKTKLFKNLAQLLKREYRPYLPDENYIKPCKNRLKK